MLYWGNFKMKKILVLQAFTMASILYKDLIEDKNTTVIYVNDNDKGKLVRSIRSAHTCLRAAQYGELPLKEYWYRKILLDHYSDGDVFIFQLDSAMRVGLKNLEYLRKLNIPSYLILLDSVNAHSWTMKYGRKYVFSKVWKKIASFDFSDCINYGFTYLEYAYYSLIPMRYKETTNYDLYYAGRLKEKDTRTDIIKHIANRVNGRIKFKVILTGIKKKKIEVENANIYKSNLPYEKILENVMDSNCILELLQPGQSNQTVRYFEAVCYGKKLLTNNPNLDKLPFYNSQYMRKINTVEEIDLDWVRKKEYVNYNYDNSFSPLRIYQILGLD